MESILEYIMTNYIWFLCGGIVILLAIIGSYADKTNFGQGKQNEKNITKDEEINLKELENKGIGTLADQKQDIIEEERDLSSQKEDIIEEPIQLQNVTQEQSTKNIEINNEVLQQQENVSNVENSSQQIVSEENEVVPKPPKIDFEHKFDEFDKEFEELIPHKEIINGELLEDIESLSLEKTQKIDLSEIPDLDDVELPKIKSLEPQHQDIWKF